MGQKLDTVSHNRSQAELLYEMVPTGNVEAIKALHRKGASLEWTDEEGKTPLMLACMDSGLLHVARVLIELGASVNAYRSGCHGGTPLHHAARSGLQQTVELLLCHRANTLVRNDNHQTPLDVARFERHTDVVRAIENHICYFSGWMREFYGPGFLQAVTPQLLSRNVWVVVVPCCEEPLKLELIVYPTHEDSRPRTVIALWKSKVEEPTFDQWDPKLTILNNFPRTRYSLASALENDKQQLQCLYSTCRGIRQVKPSTVLPDSHTSSLDASQTAAKASNLMLRGASVQSEAINTNGWGSSGDSNSYGGWGSSLGARHTPEVNTNGWMDKPSKDDYNGWGLLDSKPATLRGASVHSEAINTNGWGSSGDSNSCGGWGSSLGARHSPEVNTNGWMAKQSKDDYNGWGLLDSKPVQNVQSHDNNSPVVFLASSSSATAVSVPSAPPIPDEVLGEGPIHYPSINFSALDIPVPSMVEASMTSSMKIGADDSSCAICWEAPIQGACIPCGHMAGCMSCLNEIKANKGVCPICLTKMDQVVRLYAV